ncbi:hypothetical protein P7K49_020727 [Saguinus oedipus]|uniref:Uncharacterized protein n=1 Tax=Saguinus oedipus TaxID=9490 RepID=A0ABQ9V1S5_SAGOE|nr:hypothetical protein P7K49_020727 [Saguinus oedipus]
MHTASQEPLSPRPEASFASPCPARAAPRVYGDPRKPPLNRPADPKFPLHSYSGPAAARPTAPSPQPRAPLGQARRPRMRPGRPTGLSRPGSQPAPARWGHRQPVRRGVTATPGADTEAALSLDASSSRPRCTVPYPSDLAVPKRIRSDCGSKRAELHFPVSFSRWNYTSRGDRGAPTWGAG